MKITDIISSRRRPFPSIEIVPPKRGITKDELMASIAPFMEFAPPYVNVTCHRQETVFRPESDGNFSRHLVRSRISGVAVCAAVMQSFDIEIVPHVICAGATTDQIEDDLHDYKFLGLQNLMAIRGDAAQGEKRFTPEKGGYAHASDLVTGIRRFCADCDADFCIGVGAYPEKHIEATNMDSDIANLRRKVEAGADFIITQMFFDNARFYDFERRCREAGITVPIIPGLKPLSTRRHLELLPQTFAIDIPRELSEAVTEAGDDKTAVFEIGSEWCRRQCRDLLAHGVPAIHFFTMGRSENVINVIKECF